MSVLAGACGFGILGVVTRLDGSHCGQSGEKCR